ncbi:nitrate reductase molybdenum cofactor assembly chaperone [Methylonatrum kenyense]|uniref:nitrate reductase molybdenum cofactor assembly chaperone n=1 Tax=Methylonatrum kenyense TaxID=455253 RepID=UPI0020BF988B|nr:nitrate reductase molybdenum cofactor assembly chaperone [Methylonatrum kenyense]MCK8515816.1 nitrate reductase molybdenum cofactor assembly chaperone [Methylonatrum kenyense]
MREIKLLSALLDYPSGELQQHAGELLDVVEQSPNLCKRSRHRLAALIVFIRDADLIELQSTYVGLFDRSRTLSLHLFEHVHGEARDRGQAMVELMEIYQNEGFEISSRELPDYLPLFLEFCSRQAPDTAIDWMQRSGHLLQEMEARLSARNSPYAAAFQALLDLTGLPEAGSDFHDKIHREPADDTPDALDRAWEEEPVTFGPGAAACGSVKTDSGQAVPVDVSNLGRPV